ncbi:STAS domain-containing protein [Alkalicoccobacillus murimartini]|uniref:Anti-anti-sigma factor n=1 Tax=Alkalicoccobacillus murimartini TaxID=171685 RepID=A0ABT9YKF6_9BACI|nr:STAS domain-containing protein [Alkalicoccobacillus murimartini]MDQ0207702.1 anti-anti-sigma factor [Alkalicoccobacillus murimartini]
MSLTFQLDSSLNRTVIHLEGILDITTVHLIEPLFQNMNESSIVILDLTKVEIIDSSGIGFIINMYYLSKDLLFQLMLQGENDLTKKLFKTVGVYEILRSDQKEKQSCKDLPKLTNK